MDTSSDLRKEIAINVGGPLHLTSLLLPHLLQAKDAAIVNVTSGLAFNPMAHAPFYCATKAMVHSYTLTLRAQLADKGVHVIEVAPPAVATDLGGAGVHAWATPVDEFADAIFRGFEAGADDIGYGFTEQNVKRAREEFEAFQARLRQRQ